MCTRLIDAKKDCVPTGKTTNIYTSVIMEEVLQHLSVHHSPTSSSQLIKESDAWLREYQHAPQAWQVADELLSTNIEHTEDGAMPHIPIYATHYAALTLYRKIQDDLMDLDNAAREGLRVQLFEHTTNYARIGGQHMAVARKLCECIGALACQMLDIWQTVVEDCISLLPQTDHTLLRVQIDVLAELPRQPLSRTLYLGRDKRRDYLCLLDSKASAVVSHLCELMQSAEGDSDAQRQVFECFYSWLRNCRIPDDAIANNALVPALFDALQYDELFNAAVDSIVELILLSNPKDEKYASLREAFVPLAMQLNTNFLNGDIDLDDFEIAKGYCRIFSQMGETYLEEILSGSQDAFKIIEALMHCLSNDDVEVMTYSVNFWFDFGLRYRPHKDGEQAEHLVDMATRLLELILTHAAYPPDYQGWQASQQEEFRVVRGDIVKIVRVVGKILTVEHTLTMLTTQAQTILQSGELSNRCLELESVLYCVRNLARLVSMETCAEVAPIMELVNHLPPHPQVQYTGLLVVSRYAKWLSSHPESLSTIFTTLMQALMNKETQSAAALCFKNVCLDCGQLMVQNIAHLLDLHTHVVELGTTIDERDLNEVVQGVSGVVALLPHEQIEEAMTSLCGPHINIAIDDSVSLDDKERALQALANIIKTAKPPRNQRDPSHDHPAFTVWLQAWSVLSALLQQASNTRLMECFSECVMEALRSFTEWYAPHVEELYDSLANAFMSSQQACFVDIVHCCTARLSSQPNALDMLVGGVAVWTDGVNSMFQNVDLLEEHPAVVERFFALGSVMLTHFPEHLSDMLRTPTIATMLDMATRSLCVVEAMALKSVFNFFDELLRVATLVSGPPHLMNARPVAVEVVGPLVPQILHKVINSVAISMPIWACRDTAHLLQKLRLLDAEGTASVLQSVLEE